MYTRNRIKLLSDLEIDAIYSLPVFNETERSLYFTFTDQEIAIARKYRTIKSQVYFLLCLGYFKAKQQFYTVDLSSDIPSQDVHYVLEKYVDKNHIALSGQVDHKTVQKQKADILMLLGYQDWSSKYRPQIESHIGDLLRYYPKGHNALRQLLGYFDQQQLVIPTYRQLQDMFTAAFSAEEKRLSQIILSIPACKQEQISALINRDDGFSQLNIIGADQKDFQYTAVRAEVEKAQGIADLYEFSKKFIPTLMLSKNAIRYYADVARQYAASRLRRLSKPQQWLYAICFVYHRYQQIMDNLITSFMYHTRAIMESGKTYAEMAMMEHSASLVVDFPKLAQFLEWFPTRNKELDHDALNRAAYRILPEEREKSSCI